MRKEHTKTSPEQLFRNHYHASYLSPRQPSFNSPSHQQHEDDFQRKYPTSYKYNAVISPKQQEARSPQPPSHNHTIEISQLKLTINQLRNSLQASSETTQRMQDELFQERSKNMELNEVRRRMEEELKRMEFQLDRITNYEALEARESSIKLQTALRENSRLSMQVSELLEEVKSLKGEQRKVVSQCDRLHQEKQILLRENESLLQKLQSLQEEVRAVRREVALQSQQNIALKSEVCIPSRVNNMSTVRTNIVNNSPRNMGSRQSIELEQLSEEVDYEEQNKRLLEDYQRLIEENESMKQLYDHFYSNSPDSHPSFSNRKIVEQMISPQPDLMLKTTQKEDLVRQVSEVRESAISQLLKAYHRTVDQSKKDHQNCLKLFIHELSKNKAIYSQMAENYLEIRSTVEQETAIKIPNKLSPPSNDKQRMVMEIYKTVKQKGRGEKEIGIVLAIFRLLTLLSKSSPLSAPLLQNLKHSILKYVYKLGRGKEDTEQD